MPSKAATQEKETSQPELTAYCLKCRDKKPLNDPEYTTLKNGKPAATGPCPDCGTKLYRIGAKAA